MTSFDASPAAVLPPSRALGGQSTHLFVERTNARVQWVSLCEGMSSVAKGDLVKIARSASDVAKAAGLFRHGEGRVVSSKGEAKPCHSVIIKHI